MVALPRTSCGIAETARIARYMAGESAGQCGPCIFGLPAIADDLEQLWAGRADAAVLDRIQMRAATVEGRGACRHPDGVVRLVRSALAVFAADTLDHARGRPVLRTRLPDGVDAFPTGAAGTGGRHDAGTAGSGCGCGSTRSLVTPMGTVPNCFLSESRWMSGVTRIVDGTPVERGSGRAGHQGRGRMPPPGGPAGEGDVGLRGVPSAPVSPWPGRRLDVSHPAHS